MRPTLTDDGTGPFDAPERWGSRGRAAVRRAPDAATPSGPALYHEMLGSTGPVLVFLAGVGGTTRYWRSRVEPLATTHRVLLVDLLGFGRSPKPWTKYTVERHVAALHGVLHDVLGDSNTFTLVGHSFGAIAAAAYAARHAELIDRLVLVSLPCFGSETRALAYFRGRRSADRWFMTNIVLAAAACVVTRRVLRRVLPRLLPDMPREVVEDLVLHTWRSSTSTIWEGVYRHDTAADLTRLPDDVPVLFLHGDQDTTAPLAGLTQLLEGHPNSALRVLRGGDHHPLLRRPDWVLDALRAFVPEAESAEPRG